MVVNSFGFALAKFLFEPNPVSLGVKKDRYSTVVVYITLLCQEKLFIFYGYCDTMVSSATVLYTLSHSLVEHFQ